MNDIEQNRTYNGNEIAIIGMAGRFPMASTLDEFWQNLAAGREVITTFSPEELEAAGIPPAVYNDPRYVPRKGMLENIDMFDAAFFDYSPREAEILDPQQRIFLECAWQALEHAGYAAKTYPGLIGVYAGSGTSNYYFYLLHNTLLNPELRKRIDPFQLALANEKDYLATRVSYKLNLRGPGINVQTACSTSLVAAHLACQSLLNGECDLALAGGSSIHAGQKGGYLFAEGGIYSPDGRCRAFDAAAQGTITGEGAGVVVLKRLEEALQDGDTIHAVIKGSACNNDGAMKIGYTAPGIQGQSAAIAEALAVAGVPPETVGYIEAHGTATPLGDPIEISALTQAFRRQTARKNFCAIGSLKTNMGHLSAAAGIAGLLKTVLALKHQMLPPSLHFATPNPQIDFDNSPFYVNTSLTPWSRGEGPLRAGVSSFGMGGTNAHMVLEEAPPCRETTTSRRPWQIIPLSAKTASALELASTRLAAYLRQHPEVELADTAYTLQVGRNVFNHRQVLIGTSREDIAQALERSDPERLFTATNDVSEQPVTFLFPGQGAQYVSMGRELYQHEVLFRTEVDRCAELLLPHLHKDLRSVLYPSDVPYAAAEQQLTQTWLAQPALFVVEYALARLWESWGIAAHAMLGHSIGEFVAACLAGVFSLEDALAVVAARGRLMFQCAPGAMLAVSLPEQDVAQQLMDFSNTWEEILAIAAINAPDQCTISGPTTTIEVFSQHLQKQGIRATKLRTSHAFHSPMMEPILAEFEKLLRATTLHTPQRRYLSNLTGDWITPAQATDPAYWAQHIRGGVRFSDGIATLLRDGPGVLLEVGPGKSLGSFARRQMPASSWPLIISSLRHANEVQPDLRFLLTSLGRLWLSGVRLDWCKFHEHEQRQRIPLPTYPFERQRYWVDLPSAPARSHTEQQQAQDKPGAATIAPTVQTDTARSPVSGEPVSATKNESATGRYRRPDLANAYAAPRDETDRMIAEIWSSLLGIDKVGIYDNFFDLGGHSLLATQIISRIRADLRCHIPLNSLFEMPTIAALAAFIQDQHAQPQNALPELTRANQEHLTSSVLAGLESLSDQEIDALLTEALTEE